MNMATAWTVYYGRSGGTTVAELVERIWEDCTRDESEAAQEVVGAAGKLFLGRHDTIAWQNLTTQVLRGITRLAQSPVSLVTMTGIVCANEGCLFCSMLDAQLDDILLCHISRQREVHIPSQGSTDLATRHYFLCVCVCAYTQQSGCGREWVRVGGGRGAGGLRGGWIQGVMGWCVDGLVCG